MMDSFVCIDLETTGLNPKMDKIIEIGAVKVIHGKKTDTFSTFINPGRRLEERIVELTGITDEKLKDAPPISEVIGELLLFTGDYPLLGHSILFDFSFIKKAAVDQKMFFERKAVDTLKIARKYLPELESRSLGYLCDYYEIPHRAHRALEDADATIELYERLKQTFYAPEEKLFFPQPLQFKIKRDQPASLKQKERLYRLLELHGIAPDVEIEMLSRSEASRLTDQIYATYGH